ncbi:MAG: Lrp/AsnC ligand binding domain-containing protein [Haloferacaceae archaeon]
MVVAYVMVTASTGEAERLKAAMSEVDGVVSVDVVAGDVDFVVKVEVDSPEAVREVATDHIHAIDGVADTRTYIAMG